MEEDKILSILCNCIEKENKEMEDIPLDYNLLELGLDSINFIKFIVSIEEAFNIEIEDTDLLTSNFDTLNKVYQTLQKYFL